jgi:hypothetical protein
MQSTIEAEKFASCLLRAEDRGWIVNMSVKVNLKKYLAHEGKWQFFPVLKIDGKSRAEAVMIGGEPVKGTPGKFYFEFPPGR